MTEIIKNKDISLEDLTEIINKIRGIDAKIEKDAIKIAKKTRTVVLQNIVLALGVKLFVLVLGALGIAYMWEAVFADVGVSLIAIFNSLRILRYKSN